MSTKDETIIKAAKIIAEASDRLGEAVRDVRFDIERRSDNMPSAPDMSGIVEQLQQLRGPFHDHSLQDVCGHIAELAIELEQIKTFGVGSNR